eukprot:g10554.t1
MCKCCPFCADGEYSGDSRGSGSTARHPFASVVGAAVNAALDFHIGREKRLSDVQYGSPEVRNIAQAVQRSHDQSEQAWTTQAQQWRQRKLQQVKDWVSRVKFCVLETLSGVYRSPAERLAAEKAMEVAGFLIAGSCREAQTGEQVVELLLELVGPGPQLPPPAAAAATSTVEVSGGASSASGLSSSSFKVVEVAAARQESLAAARRDSLVKRAQLEEMLKSERLKKADLEEKLQSVTLQLEGLKNSELQSVTLELEKMKNEKKKSTVKQAPGDAKLAELDQREVGRHQAQLDEQGHAIQVLVQHIPQAADELHEEAGAAPRPPARPPCPQHNITCACSLPTGARTRNPGRIQPEQRIDQTT